MINGIKQTRNGAPHIWKRYATEMTESKAMGKDVSGLGWHYKSVGEDRLLNETTGYPCG